MANTKSDESLRGLFWVEPALSIAPRIVTTMPCRRRAQNLLPALKDEDLDVVCIGKIASIYDSMGVTEDLTAKNNQQSIDQTIHALNQKTRGLIFSNLVDFDMLYGHRRDTEGYARALEHFDSALPANRSGDA